jgi:hypothetical protein
MKNNLGVWIDGTKAVIVNLASDSVTEVLANIDSKTNHISDKEVGNFLGAGHHNANERTYEERKKHQTHAYLHNVAVAMKDADGIYIFGPSEMKSHLKTHIEADKKLATAIVAVEAADKMTDNQIVAAVKKRFAQ